MYFSKGNILPIFLSMKRKQNHCPESTLECFRGDGSSRTVTSCKLNKSVHLLLFLMLVWLPLYPPSQRMEVLVEVVGASYNSSMFQFKVRPRRWANGSEITAAHDLTDRYQLWTTPSVLCVLFLFHVTSSPPSHSVLVVQTSCRYPTTYFPRQSQLSHILLHL